MMTSDDLYDAIAAEAAAFAAACVKQQELRALFLAGEGRDHSLFIAARAGVRYATERLESKERLEGVPQGETLEGIDAWLEETFGPIQPARCVQRAKEEMDELEEKDCLDVEEAADVVICMLHYPGVVEAIQHKMVKNRRRRWRLVGDGTGYHIKEGEPG